MTTVEVITEAEASQEPAIRALLSAFNAEHGWPDAPAAFQVVLRDAAGAVRGGVLARANWQWLWIVTLAVAPELRGQGHGGRLLAAAEAHACGLGCVGVRLDTYSFQARTFYEKQGYAVRGAIENCPPGHTRFTMAKPLEQHAVAIAWPDDSAPRATITPTGTEHEPAIAPILQGLIGHNAPFAGEHGYAPVNLVVRRPGEAAACGGLVAFVLYRWLFVRMFYLPDDLRHGGLGTVLMRRAEDEARARGCIGIWLDTFSFQARPFYERLGFRGFGSLADFPPGHSRHFLMKRLDGAGDSQ